MTSIAWRVLACSVLIWLFAAPAAAQSRIDQVVAGAVRATQAEFAKANLKDDHVAVTVIDLSRRDAPQSGSFRGDQPIFPASVVKLFYLAYAQRLLEDGNLDDSDELQRGLRDMIVESSNDATSYVLDAITDAPNGAVLPPAEMERWAAKRDAVNRYFASLGYAKINVNQKAYCEGPYGRERAFIGPKLENRNKLTTDATATLLAEIALRRMVTPARSEAMLALLSRDRGGKRDGPDDQAHGFIAGALPPGANVWSKAGWTSSARHDAAYVESDDGAVRAAIVIFTSGHGGRREIVPALGKRLYEGLRNQGAAPATQPVVR
jgi:beta-lactamase class A